MSGKIRPIIKYKKEVTIRLAHLDKRQSYTIKTNTVLNSIISKRKDIEDSINSKCLAMHFGYGTKALKKLLIVEQEKREINNKFQINFFIKEPKRYSLRLRVMNYIDKYFDKYLTYKKIWYQLEKNRYISLLTGDKKDKQNYIKKMNKILHFQNKYLLLSKLFDKINYTTQERIRALEG